MNKLIWTIVVIVVLVGAYTLFFQEKGPVEAIKIGIVGPLSGNQANYGTGVQEGMTLAFQELKDKKIKRQPAEFIYEDSAGDVKTAVSAAQKLISNDAAVILKQKEELGLKQQFVSQGAVEDKKIPEVAGVGAEGLIFATYNAVPPANFVEKIKAKIGSEPRRWNMEGYEAVQIIYKVLAEADALTPEGMKNVLANLKEAQGLTQMIKFDERGNALREVYVKVIRNGKFELYQ